MGDASHDLNDDEEQRRLVNETIKQTMEEMKESNFKAKSAKKLAKSAKKEKRVLNKTPKLVVKKPAAKPAETPKKEEVRKLEDDAKTASSNEGEKKQEESKDQKENKTEEKRSLEEEKKDDAKEEKKDDAKEEKKDDVKEEKKEDAKEEKKDDTAEKKEESKERNLKRRRRKRVRKVIKKIFKRVKKRAKKVVKKIKKAKKRHTTLRKPKRDTQNWAFAFPEIDSYVGNPGKYMLFEFNLRCTKLPDALAVFIILKDSAGKVSELKKFVQGKDFEPVKQKDESTVYLLPMKAKLSAEPSLKLHLSIKPELETNKEFNFYSVSDYKYEWGQLPSADEGK